METDETVYEILLNINLNDLQLFCRSNKNINQLCHTKYFIENKFNMLPFNIYRPIKHTLNNLLYVNYLYNVANKLINYMINERNVIFYNMPIKTIQDLKLISPIVTNRILDKMIEVDEEHEFYGVFEGNIFLQYNEKTIDGETVPTYDGKFYLSYWIYTPNDNLEAIDLSIEQTVEYLVNIFLNNKKYTLIESRYYQKLNNVQELEYFIDTRFIKLSSKRRVIPHYSYYI